MDCLANSENADGTESPRRRFLLYIRTTDCADVDKKHELCSVHLSERSEESSCFRT